VAEAALHLENETADSLGGIGRLKNDEMIGLASQSRTLCPERRTVGANRGAAVRRHQADEPYSLALLLLTEAFVLDFSRAMVYKIPHRVATACGGAQWVCWL
jgi:hypothetical protein